jgi:hypothetical protein
MARGEHHAAHPGIDRQPRELAAEGRQLARRIDGAELLQQLVPVADRARGRRLDERKPLDIAERERAHAQDHRGERAPEDFRVRVFRPRGEALIVIQAHADAVGDAAAAARPLVRGRLRDLLDLQQRRLVTHRNTA